jgi:ubiquinone/menaquinone biosynthesis C-methylase UbiE
MAGQTKQQGHRWFAAIYDRMSAREERRFGPLVRSRIAGEANGRVLEIGAGTGANFPYYPADAQVVATEPDPFMLKRARDRLAELRLGNVDLREASADRLPFEDASFDHAVSTLVLCSVPAQPEVLAELRRVLKPSGTFRFFEHIRNDDSRLWGTVQDVITPVWSWVGAGCHPNRRTGQAVEEAGFSIDWSERIQIGPGTFAIYGVARLS